MTRSLNYSFSTEVPEVGVLTFLGAGEAKTVLLLTTLEGKKIAVSVFGYGIDMGIQIPEDPRFMTTSKGLTERTVFSTLSTYLVVPIVDPSPHNSSDLCVGISFQEYAPRTPIRTALAPITRTVAKMLAYWAIEKRAVEKDCRRYNVADDELDKSRHHHMVGGRVAIIDVPVEFIFI